MLDCKETREFFAEELRRRYEKKFGKPMPDSFTQESQLSGLSNCFDIVLPRAYDYSPCTGVLEYARAKIGEAIEEALPCLNGQTFIEIQSTTWDTWAKENRQIIYVKIWNRRCDVV